MEHIRLGKASKAEPTVMIFAEGTVLKPRSLFSVMDHNRYVPIGNCIGLLHIWQEQGASIVYCTSRRGEEASDIAALLKKYDFPGCALYYRSKREDYGDILENVRPNILIEDDCRSNGGFLQTCISSADSDIREQIISIIVRECSGIDSLPQNISALAHYNAMRRTGYTRKSGYLTHEISI